MTTTEMRSSDTVCDVPGVVDAVLASQRVVPAVGEGPAGVGRAARALGGGPAAAAGHSPRVVAADTLAAPAAAPPPRHAVAVRRHHVIVCVSTQFGPRHMKGSAVENHQAVSTDVGLATTPPRRSLANTITSIQQLRKTDYFLTRVKEQKHFRLSYILTLNYQILLHSLH